MSCRYDREAEDYLDDDGKPCRRDSYGDPTNHCTARRTCAQHIGPDEQTCARCIGRTRADLQRIPDLAALMPEEAEVVGINSEAANLAGPAADPEAWTWRKIAARQGKAWHLSLIEDDDEQHPYIVLGRWDMMVREDYGQPSSQPVTIGNAAAYLSRQLTKIAHDPSQDFPLFAREIRTCRSHLENVLRDSQTRERGAPCPDCREDGALVRLEHEYGHYCDDEECERIHYSTVYDTDRGEHVPDTSGDAWVCPRNPQHRWTEQAYRNYIEERKEGALA